MTKVAGSKPPVFLLVDNGSIRPASTRVLRSVAEKVGEAAGVPVFPVSLDHSDRVEPGDLDGIPADTLEPFLLSDRIEAGRQVVVVPMFLGNRGAIVRRVEKVIEKVNLQRPELQVCMTNFLFEEDGAGQETLALALADRVKEQLDRSDPRKPVVVVTDHGSPLPVAAQVRNFVAGQVQAILREEVYCVIPASMERRAGERYAFTDPLLEEVLRRPVAVERPVVLAMFFLLPGRHAGEGGDVAQIREDAISETGNTDVRTTDLLAEHPLVLEALARIVNKAR